MSAPKPLYLYEYILQHHMPLRSHRKAMAMWLGLGLAYLTKKCNRRNHAHRHRL